MLPSALYVPANLGVAALMVVVARARKFLSKCDDEERYAMADAVHGKLPWSERYSGRRRAVPDTYYCSGAFRPTAIG